MITTREQASWYLAGIIDGEGCVSPGKNNYRVVIVNTDESIIEAVQEALDILGIDYKKKTRVRKNLKHKILYEVVIGRRSEYSKIALLVELQCESKRLKLKKISNTPYRYTLENDPIFCKIRELYADGSSQREIAESLDVSRRLVQSVMNRARIQPRPRGSHSRVG
jgi:intein/homing endonuclease